MLPVVATLLAQGLSLIGNAVIAKGKDWVEEKAGVKLPEDGSPIPPCDLVKLKQVEMDHEEELLRLRIEDNKLDLEGFRLEVQNESDINATMREEGKSEHWAQWLWRPFIGFSFGVSFGCCALLVCMLGYQAVLGGRPEAMQMIPALVGSFAMLFAVPLPILGVASYFRGKAKLAKEQSNG